MDRVKLLSEYGSFLKNNHLDELAEENRQFLTSVDLHLINISKEISVDDLLKMSVTNLTKLLEAFEKGKITKEIISQILKLELEALPGIKPEYINSNDLLSIYSAQKQAVLWFIPKFTTEIKIIKELTKEIELTFLQAMDFTIQSYVKQRVEAAEKVIENKIREETANYYNQELKAANLVLKKQNETSEKLQEEVSVSYEELTHQNEDLVRLQEALLARQEDLVGKEIELTRSNQSLDQFANMASHDLKEPLRMIKQYVTLLAKRYKDKLDKDANDFIGYAVDGVERMEHLIKSILDYAKLNKLGVPVETTFCQTALDRAKTNLSVAIEESRAKITNDDLPELKVNSVQLTQVFQNLLSNALKYRSPDINAKIHIGVEKKDHTWFFSVSDNGIGIKPEEFERIFRPFNRLHSNQEYEGIGLGLTFCKKTVEQYGGDIWVESEPGKGTTFYFTFKE